MSFLDSLKSLCCSKTKEAPKAEVNVSLEEKAEKFIDAVGGKENIEILDSCITRLRLTLKDRSLVNKAKLNELGSKGNVNVGAKGLQIIIGTKAETISNLMKAKI